PIPPFTDMRQGSVGVFLRSSVKTPSHSASNGVTFTMIPHRAYVPLPTPIVRQFRGIRKYSTELASAKEFGGTMQTSLVNSTKDFGSKRFGSTTADKAFVKILKSAATRMSW